MVSVWPSGLVLAVVLFFLIVVLVLATLGGVGCWRGVHELATGWLRFLFPWWV